MNTAVSSRDFMPMAVLPCQLIIRDATTGPFTSPGLGNSLRRSTMGSMVGIALTEKGIFPDECREFGKAGQVPGERPR